LTTSCQRRPRASSAYAVSTTNGPGTSYRSALPLAVAESAVSRRRGRRLLEWTRACSPARGSW
jgi:hypothetical protein